MIGKINANIQINATTNQHGKQLTITKKAMKVVSIKIEDHCYVVELEPNAIQRFFGMKKRLEKYKIQPFDSYVSGGSVYFNQKGEELRDGHYIQKAIDNYRRSWD